MTRTRSSVNSGRSTALARAQAEDHANRLVAVHWHVVAGPPGCATTEVTLEDPERLAKLGIETTEPTSSPAA